MSKSLIMLALVVSLVIGVMLVSGCTTKEPEPPTQIILNLTPEQADDLIQENANNVDFFIIDVQTPQEFAEGHIENAILIDYYSETFTNTISYLDRDKIYLIYCQNGVRSGAALAIMEDLGFMEVYHLESGIEAWQAAELPVVTE